MSRAGWCSGRFKAVKLCQSSSISGPSEIVKPIWLKMSMILFLTIESGCLFPVWIGKGVLVGSEILDFPPVLLSCD